MNAIQVPKMAVVLNRNLYVLFSQYRPRDILEFKGIYLLSFPNLCLTHTHMPEMKF